MEGHSLQINIRMLAVLAWAAASLACLVPSLAVASLIVAPQGSGDLLSVADPRMPAEFLGVLDGYPHTYSFDVSEESGVSILLRIPQNSPVHDAGMILVREETRGVSEVGRTLAGKAPFSAIREPIIAATFLDAGTIEAQLKQGSYRLEVSSPSNDASYQLIFNRAPKRSYFENLQYLLLMNGFLKRSPAYLLFSPIIYAPLLIAAAVGLAFYLYVRNRTHA